jgi:ribosomal protein S12 methylthiotransferase RimO
MTESDSARSVSLVTLGCARNEVDSEELAERLAAEGWDLVADPEQASLVMVNTCGFVEQAKRDSIETILDVADLGRPVVAVGCLAERYGAGLAAELPEATVLGFDDYPDIAERLADIYAGRPPAPHAPQDRRRLLPITPVDRVGDESIPGHNIVARRRLMTGPSTPVKLASGCDRRCTFCAIPAFRGAFVSRSPVDLTSEVSALAAGGFREVVLVSENSTSYGKDLGELRLLESLLERLAAAPGLHWVRVSYLQPAEMRPSLVAALTSTPGVARYFDLSFQHASPTVLRRMRRFGGTAPFLDLLAQIRSAAPTAGVRSNFIVGFPGESESDFDEVCAFLEAADLDAIGVFGYSAEEGTEAAGFQDALSADVISHRVSQLTELADRLMEQRAEQRVGEQTTVLIEQVADGTAEGRAEHQGPDDASTTLPAGDLRVGDVVAVEIVGTFGVDLVAEAIS